MMGSDYDPERPEGFIKTLPTLYGDETLGKQNFHRTLKAIESGLLDQFYIFLSGKPKYEVLHLYILIEGRIVCRANIAEIEKQEPDTEMNSWDGQVRKVKYMAICTGPISYPPEPVHRKGFQGIRYCGKLW